MAIFYVISTPIGNLEDIGFRAIRILKEVDLVLAEDTRTTSKLFKKYNITTPILSYHAQSGHSKIDSIIEKIGQNKNIALVTDAGTPGISDPGSFLISKIYESYPDIKIVSVPGPSALTAALSISGVDTHEFIFLGFMPNKKGRETLFKEISLSERTVVFYESTHRIIKTLESLKKCLALTLKKVVLVREITKIYEEVIRGSAEEVFNILTTDHQKQKGEFVIIVSI